MKWREKVCWKLTQLQSNLRPINPREGNIITLKERDSEREKGREEVCWKLSQLQSNLRPINPRERVREIKRESIPETNLSLVLFETDKSQREKERKYVESNLPLV